MTSAEFPEAGRELFRALKTPGVGEQLMLDRAMFLDGLPPAYRRPYPSRESRLPLLRWARMMPLDGDPADVVSRVERYDDWLVTSPGVPKLLITFRPGPDTMLREDLIDWCATHISALDLAAHDLVAGHHTPEDQPEAVAGALAHWLDRHQLR